MAQIWRIDQTDKKMEAMPFRSWVKVEAVHFALEELAGLPPLSESAKIALDEDGDCFFHERSNKNLVH